MRVPVLALAGVLLVAGCDSSPGSSAQPTPRTSATSASSSPTATPSPSAAPTHSPTYVVRVVPPDADGFTLVGFRSPSRNLQCAIGAEEKNRTWARCDVTAHSWTLPPKPADCDLDWGSVATLANDGKPGRIGACVSDSPGGGPTLAYGHAIRLKDMECRSSTAGVECVTGKHGFRVSKASYRVW